MLTWHIAQRVGATEVRKRAYNPAAHKVLAQELAARLHVHDPQPMIEAAVDEDSFTGRFWDPKPHARAHESREQVQARVDTEIARAARALHTHPESKTTLQRLGRLSHLVADQRAHQLKAKPWTAGREWAHGSHARGMLVNFAEHLRQPDIDMLDAQALRDQRQLAAKIEKKADYTVDKRTDAERQRERGLGALLYLLAKRGLTKGAAFDIGFEKAALSVAQGVGLTLAAGSGILAIYDLMKARGYDDDVTAVRKAISEGKLVDSRRFVAKIDKKIEVCTNTAEIKKALAGEPGLSAWRRTLILNQVAPALKGGHNAFALRGEHGDYIFAPAQTGAEVLAHEIGHILDFRARKLTFKDMGPYETGFADVVWKPSFETHVMGAERRAWKKAPDLKRPSELEHAALNTYEKSFHHGRAFSATTLAVLLAAGSLVKAAANPGSYEADVSAPGVTATNTDLPRTDEQTMRNPGNARKGRGVPEWLRFNKYLPSKATW